MTSAIKIRPIKKTEYDDISRGFEDWYWPFEPLSIGYRIKTPSPIEKHLFTALPEEAGMTLVATLPEENDKIVGFLVNAPNHPKIMEEVIEKVGDQMDERLEAFLGIMAAVEGMVNIFEKFNIEKSFHLVAIAVDPAMRGKNIGCMLFESAFEMAKNLGFTVASVDCTSKFSTNIAKKLNMTPLAAIEYKEYKDSEGNQIFSPPPEHTHMTSFVKEL